jgi:hypothetical protein
MLQDGVGMLIVEGECSLCGCKIVYSHRELFVVIALEHCPSCKGGLSIYPFDYVNAEIFDRSLSTLSSMGKVAIWPVVTGVHKILEWSPAARGTQVYFVDSSKSKQGRRLLDEIVGGTVEPIKRIENPRIIQQEEIGTIVLTTAQGAARLIIETIKSEYPSVKRICFAGEMIFDDFEVNGRYNTALKLREE